MNLIKPLMTYLQAETPKESSYLNDYSMSRFRTIEVSDQQFEAGGLRFITVKSPNLKGRGDICVYAPQTDKTAVLPIVILLHGVYGSAWSWAYSAGVHIKVNELINAGK